MRWRLRRWSLARTRMTPAFAWSVTRGEPLAGLADVFALFVLHGCVGADDRRPGQGLRPRLADLRVELPRRQASSLHVPQCGTCGVPDCNRSLAAEPCEGERPLRIDLADPRRLDRRALREVPEAGGRRSGVQTLDEADGVGQAGFLDEQALEQVDARVEVLVDRQDDVVDRRALLHDLTDGGDRLVQAGGELSKRH